MAISQAADKLVNRVIHTSVGASGLSCRRLRVAHISLSCLIFKRRKEKKKFGINYDTYICVYPPPSTSRLLCFERVGHFFSSFFFPLFVVPSPHFFSSFMKGSWRRLLSTTYNGNFQGTNEQADHKRRT